MRVAIYLRISTRDKGQDTANQLRQLQDWCATQSLSVVRIYEDHDSGSRPDRREFQRMLEDAATREFDLLLFWSLDRFTREGTLATLKHLERLESCGVHWRSLTEAWIDSAGPFREVIISLLASLAKQERIRISERVRAGLNRAKAGGTKSGRPIGRPRVVCRRDLIVQLRQQGLSWRQIARQARTSVASVRRIYHATAGGELGQNPL
jgi:DNA invertase Pin-like site-specific DNA recombinase